MTEKISDTARRIIDAGTPDNCLGCYKPMLRGIFLGGRVEAGGMTEVEATEGLNEELTEKCKFGNLRKWLGEQCMYGIARDGVEAPTRARLRKQEPWE